MGPMEAMCFPSFERAAAAVATFELRVRMLAEQATEGMPVQKTALSADLTVLIGEVAVYFKATTDDTKYLKACAVVRNKLFHLRLSSVTGRIESLLGQLVAEGLAPAKLDKGRVSTVNLDTGEVSAVEKTSTEKEGIYGWMLESTLSGAFDALVVAMDKGTKIIERLRDAHIAAQIKDLPR